MKKYNINFIFSIALFFFIVGGLTADFGESQPAYTVDLFLILEGISALSLFFALGWFSAKEHYKN